MAEAPNILLLLSLTSILDSMTSYLIFCELWTIVTLLCLVRNKWHDVAKQALKSDKSIRESSRQQRISPANHLRYHCFKQRMKHKRMQKGHYKKPKPLFHLTWKYKAMKLTIRLAASIYQAGCRVERLVGRSFQLLLCVHSLIYQLELNCRLKTHSVRHAFKSTGTFLSHPFRPRFDTDSFRIGIDTLCSITMSGKKECFKDLKPSEGATIVGIAGGLVSKGTGTFCFNIEDEDGVKHHIELPHSLYIPGLPQTLLCPQHWAQVDADGGTYITNTATGCWLVWNKGKSKKFVPLDPCTNTPAFFTSSGTFNYRAFEATYLACDASTPQLRQHVRYDALLRGGRQHHPESFIADEDINLKDKELWEEDEVSEDDETVQISNVSHLDVASGDKCPIHPTSNHIWGECTHNPDNQSEKRGTLTFSPRPHRTQADQQNDSMAASDDQAELLRWHHRLGHLPFSMLKALAKNGEIPKKFEKIKEPRCAGCLFGKMTKVPWRTRSRTSSKVHEASYPGECVSVDQMESTQAGFVAQLKGRLTTKRYKAATIFVDHFSRLRYVHIMSSLTSKETVEAKQAFERFAADHGVRIKQYHADNGRFADNAFKQHCSQQRQAITYCGVNAHFQNGIAERAIRDITEAARTMLLHAKARWPSAVHLSLWPYAVRMAVHIHNTVPVLLDGRSRLELFSGTNVGFRMRDNHAFGCPVRPTE
jgi:hypothetical protein